MTTTALAKPGEALACSSQLSPSSLGSGSPSDTMSTYTPTSAATDSGEGTIALVSRPAITYGDMDSNIDPKSDQFVILPPSDGACLVAQTEASEGCQATSRSGSARSEEQDPELQESGLTSLVVFDGDNGSCKPHRFNPGTGYLELGRGAYGVVFAVQCDNCHNLYARKIISFRNVRQDHREEFIQKAENELDSYRTLNHPHILRYVHHERTEKRLDIFTEYCQWRDLDSLIPRERGIKLPVDIVWHLFNGIASAVARCHQGLEVDSSLGVGAPFVRFDPDWEPILHRDIKPANILLALVPEDGSSDGSEVHDEIGTTIEPRLDADDEIDAEELRHNLQSIVPKLGDFGMSFKLERGGKTPSTQKAGTPAFWAPEIWEESRKFEGRIKTWSEKSDMWATGGVLYEMITSELPKFNYPSSENERESALKSKLGGEYDPLLLRILVDCLDPNPVSRATALHILPATLKADASASGLVRSASFWKCLGSAPSSIPVGDVIRHFVQRYLPVLAKDNTVFSELEAVMILNLVAKHNSDLLCTAAYLLASGFQDRIDGGTIFHALACISDPVAIAQAFHKEGWASSESVSHLLLQKTKLGLLPSNLAAFKRHIDLCKRLSALEDSARRDSSERRLQVVLKDNQGVMSAKHGDEFDFMFRLLVSSISASQISIPKRTSAVALIEASQRGYANMVKKLIEMGISPSLTGRRQETALHIFAHAGNGTMTRFLLQKGAHVDSADKKGCTALHWAAWHGKLETVEILLQATANVNAQDVDGRSPLFGAAGGGFLDVVDKLISCGADVDLRGGEKKQTALERAEQRGFHSVAAALRKMKEK